MAFTIKSETRRVVHGKLRFMRSVSMSSLINAAHDMRALEDGRYLYLHVGQNIVPPAREIVFVYALKAGEDDKRHLADVEELFRERFGTNYCGHEISSEQVTIIK